MFDFSANTVVEKLDKVPKDFRGLYVETEDGKYKLDTVDPKVASAVSAVTGLNKALNDSRGEVEKLKTAVVDLAPLAAYGENMDDIVGGITTAIADAGKNAKGKGADDVKAAVKSATDAQALTHAKEMQAHVDDKETLSGQIRNLLVTGQATAALASAKAIDVDLVLPHLEKLVKVDKVDGELVVNIIGADKQIRYNGSGSPMTIDELVTEMKDTDKYKSLFESDGTTGGGNPPTQHGGPAPAGKVLTSTENITQGLADRGIKQ